ncbi:MAG: VacB/RNase II family 3'-5' exoribonuclease [Planctomycetota bacterium]|nr:MAG: VacB/RNase II family 3'-5' exoribonuclease [Planctomycetota bacterium]
MSLRYRSRLLAHLSHEGYEPKGREALAAELGAMEDRDEFLAALDDFHREGLIDIDSNGAVRLASLPDRGELTGTFRGTSKGFGFVQPDNPVREGDIFIPAELTGGALSGDRVRIVFSRDRKRERYAGLGKQFRGEVVEILSRKRSNFTGEMVRQGDRWLAYPDGKEITDPIIVRDASSKNVKPGDKVVLEILEYPDNGALAEGVIVRVLGEAGAPDVETAAVIAAYGLPGPFPDECLQQARQVTRLFDEEIDRWEKEGPPALSMRNDVTGRFDKSKREFVLTIDPPDAKDYDDAISIRRLPADQGGGWQLGVHIADVAHFVEPDTPLDLEARERGNSVYLPRLVIPMLPELLSNGICSLQEGVPRYAKSAYIRYDSRGNVRAEGVASSLIQSAKRLTYLEAQALIDGDEEEARRHAKTEPNYTDELFTALHEMNQLARAIEARRHRQGMIHLELPEVVLLFDENGKVIDAEKEDDAYTHTIIEMLMVEANEVLARLFEGLRVPLLRRVHPEPAPSDVDHLQKAARVAGFTIPKSPTREEIQALLDATRGTPAARAVHMAVLRTLTKAEYSPAAIGHFALASGAYSHFTSPIRRYPDLTVHRALAEYLRLTDNGQNRPKTDREKRALGARLRDRLPDEATLVEIGRHCSQTEENAANAERELRQFLVLQLLAEKIGEEFTGVVTGVVPRGVFVQIDKYLADGMIKREDLPGDVTRSNKPPRWQIDQRTGALVDVHSGRSFNMGDIVRVTVSAVDLARRQLELLISDPESRAVGRAKTLKGLKLGDSDFGGLEGGKGAGFKPVPGSKRRSRKSKARDRNKTDYRRDRKKGK